MKERNLLIAAVLLSLKNMKQMFVKYLIGFANINFMLKDPNVPSMSQKLNILVISLMSMELSQTRSWWKLSLLFLNQ